MALAERGRQMITIVAVLVSLASMAVVLRIFARLKLRLKFAIDDYLCFSAMGFMYGMFVELVLCEYEGPGARQKVDFVNKGAPSVALAAMLQISTPRPY
jgi:hypothetical protein